MILLLLLLLATGTPVVHQSPATSTTASPKTPATQSPEQQALAAETRAANAEGRTALWTMVLAFATVGLGAVTVVVTIMDNRRNAAYRAEDKRIRQDEARVREQEAEAEKRERTNAAIRELYQIVVVFRNRVNRLVNDGSFNPESLGQGLDVLLSRALSDDVARAVPLTLDFASVYGSLFNAFDTIAYARHYQAESVLSGTLDIASRRSLDRLMASTDKLKLELVERSAWWKE